MRIEGQSALVTGGASGLGAATARALAAAGGKVAILDVNAERIAAMESEIGCIGIACDVRDEAQVTATLDRVRETNGDARILVQCAGIATGAKVVGRENAVDIASFRRTIEINLIGAYVVMSHAAARMAALEPVADGERGVIVNTASIAAEDGQIGQCAYAASKAGIMGLALPAARELGRSGIRVATIAPGLFSTPMMDGLPLDVQERLATLPAFPKRLGQASEYASLALHIVQNVMINGTMIRLDGGVRLEPR